MLLGSAALSLFNRQVVMFMGTVFFLAAALQTTTLSHIFYHLHIDILDCSSHCMSFFLQYQTTRSRACVRVCGFISYDLFGVTQIMHATHRSFVCTYHILA